MESLLLNHVTKPKLNNQPNQSFRSGILRQSVLNPSVLGFLSQNFVLDENSKEGSSLSLLFYNRQGLG